MGQFIQDEILLQAHPSSISFRPVKDENTAITLLKDGQIDAMTSVNPTNFFDLKENKAFEDALEFYTPEVLKYSYIGLNNKNPKLSDKSKKSTGAPLDVGELINVVLKGLANGP